MTAAARKKPARKMKPKPIAVLETKSVPLSDLTMYHKNPRIGNIDLIAESLRESGQFKPIVVNKGTHTKRKNEILAGNHTFMAMKQNGEPNIYVSFVDVSEDQAAKIVLADNKTADEATYDEAIIAELFESLPNVIGTGYSEAEMNAIMQDAEETARNVLTGLEEEDEREQKNAQREAEDEFGASLSDVDSGDDDSDDDDEDDDDSGLPTIEKQSDELDGLADLKEGLSLEDQKIRVGPWGVTRLRSDMLMKFEELPADLQTWAGSATKDHDDPDTWWFYNWGIDSTSGMKNIQQVIVSFYTWDEYFENWYWDPRKYVTKLLNSKIKYMVTPDYSMWSEYPLFEALNSLFRMRYVGRYAQEAGIKIIPNISWPMGNTKFLKEHVLATLPSKVPMIAMQIQTFDEKAKVFDNKQQASDFQLVVDTVKPEGIIIYGGKPGREWFLKNVKYDGQLKVLETRNSKLSEKAKLKEKKKTI